MSGLMQPSRLAGRVVGPQACSLQGVQKRPATVPGPLWRQLSEPAKVHLAGCPRPPPGLCAPGRGSYAPELDEEDAATTAAGQASPPGSESEDRSPCGSARASPEAAGLLWRQLSEPVKVYTRSAACGVSRQVGGPAPGVVARPVQAKAGSDACPYLVTVGPVPEGCTELMFLEELQDAGFLRKRDFDFLSIPTHGITGHSLGNCLVNFLGLAEMRAFMAAFDGRVLRQFNTAVSVTRYMRPDGVRTSTGGKVAVGQCHSQPPVLLHRTATCGCANAVKEHFNFCAHCGGTVQKVPLTDKVLKGSW